MELGVLSAMHFISRTFVIDNTYYNQELLHEVWFLD
jgi:hypothetical protein